MGPSGVVFDLATDPAETYDVSTQHADRARAYAMTLQGWTAAQKDYVLTGRR